MGYVGNQTTNSYSSLAKQTITGDGGTSYTLDHAVANAQEVEIFVNNVRQEPGVAYTVNGTALTMTGNVAASDDFYVVFQGKALQTVTPPDLSVTTAKIVDANVTTAKIADDAVTSAKLDTNISIDGDVGIGATTVDRKLHVEDSSTIAYSSSDFDRAYNFVKIENNDTTTGSATGLQFMVGSNGSAAISVTRTGDGQAEMCFGTRGGGTRAERMRLDSYGRLLVGKTSSTITEAGQTVYTGQLNAIRGGTQVGLFNRLTDDGTIISLRQNSVQEGTISVSGTTVSYNGGHLARWSQFTDGSKDASLVKGTVMTNLDQMANWTHAATDDEAEWTEDNEQLNCMAVSSVEGDANVAGVFVNWDDDDDDFNDMNIAMTGDMVIRIAQGTTVARGDLLMSAGDGTAKPQGDDIVRSKTIAKVTSITVSHTYDDGSYLVPCVLMAC